LARHFERRLVVPAHADFAAVARLKLKNFRRRSWRIGSEEPIVTGGWRV
jgi:hypothetical protein